MNLNSKKFSNFKRIDQIFRKRSNEIDRKNFYRFDRNERVSPIPNKFLNIIKKNLRSEYLTTYPNLKNLYNLISKNINIGKENILLTAGSDLAIKNCFELLIQKGDEILTIYPTYGMVDVYAKLFDAKQKKIQYEKDLKLDVNLILSKINKKTKLVILANPNSPTGTVIEEKDLKKIFIKSKKNNSFVLIDECYYGFYNKTYIHDIFTFNNLIVTRSLSKAFGLAGCRIGYLVSNKKMIKRLFKFKPMHEISYFSSYVAESFLKNNRIVDEYIKDTKNGSNHFKKFLKKKNIKYYVSYANFILVDFKNNKNFKKMLNIAKKNKILIHGEPNLPGCEYYIKFTIGPKAYMKVIENLITKIFN